MTNERHVFLSTEQAGPREVRFALAATLVSVAIFLAAAPFAKHPAEPVPAFIPAYESALVICDLITAALLFGHFRVLRSRALFVLANGYLFTASMACVHALSFPGVFSSTGLLGAGPRTTAWLYMFWHGGFPLFVIAYALLKDELRRGAAAITPRGGSRIAIPAGAAAVLALVCGLTLAATRQGGLPTLLVDNHFMPVMRLVIPGVWILNLVALVLLSRRRPHSVLDLWLLVVMCAWLFEIVLSAGLNSARYDVGWYAGRVYGLGAASFLLVVLLFETVTHYSQLAQLSAELSAANQALERLSLHDSLTELANRRFFDKYLAERVGAAQRHQRSLALVLFDLDYFKDYNDHYGHQAGDECLRRVAAAIDSCSRRSADMAARFGGEEFAMILPDTDLAGAAAIGEAARNAVAALRIPHAYSAAAPYVSLSGGVADLLRTADATGQQLIAAADRALYEAKHLGRDHLVSARTDLVWNPAIGEPPAIAPPSLDLTRPSKSTNGRVASPLLGSGTAGSRSDP